MYNLQRTGLLDRPIGGGTVWTIDGLLGECEDGLRETLSLEVLQVGPPKTFQVRAAVWLFKEYPRASLTIGRLRKNNNTYWCLHTLHIHCKMPIVCLK